MVVGVVVVWMVNLVVVWVVNLVVVWVVGVVVVWVVTVVMDCGGVGGDCCGNPSPSSYFTFIYLLPQYHLWHYPVARSL